MVNHKKPTQEELDKKIADNLKKLEEEENTSPSPSEAATSPSVSASPSSSSSPSLSFSPSPSPSEENNEDDDKKKVPVKKEEEPDYKKKFSASSREALVIGAKNKTMSKAVDDAANVTESTDEELKKEFPEWDLMSDTEKILARKNAISEKRFSILHKATQEGKDLEAWTEKVEKYVGDPKVIIKFPDLDGKEEEFKIFALKPTRRGVPLEDLIAAFLFDAIKVVPKKKGKMFEKGSGGPPDKGKRKTNKVSTAEAAKIRDNPALGGYKRYKFLLTNNLIDDSDVQ